MSNVDKKGKPQAKAAKRWELYSLDATGAINSSCGTADDLESAKRAIETKWAPHYNPGAEPGTWTEVNTNGKVEAHIYSWASGSPAFLVEENGSGDAAI